MIGERKDISSKDKAKLSSQQLIEMIVALAIPRKPCE